MIWASCNLKGRALTGIEVLNPGDWFGRAWLIEIGGNFENLYFVVEADSLSDAVDEFTDSKYGHLIRVAAEDRGDYNEENSHFAGNAGELVDLDWLMGYQIPCIYSCDRIPDGVKSTEYSAEIEILDEIDTYKVKRYKDVKSPAYFNIMVDPDETYASFAKGEDGKLRIVTPMPHINMNECVPEPNSLWFLCEDYEWRRPG